MPSIKTSESLLKIGYVSNIFTNDLYLTLVLNGPHGIGKSQIVKGAAKAMGGNCYVMDGSVLKEGDAVGIPFPFKNEDGTTEVRFIKNYIINTIWRLQKYYYEIATSKGFLNGTVKLVVEEGNEYLVEGSTKKLVRTVLDKVRDGDDNAYDFGKQLSPETKLRIVESGEIQPTFLFIDELNRSDSQTLKELMNIILNKTINGYNLPWWVNIVSAINPSSQNSSYATQELDPAQYSRFCNIKVSANPEDWVEYMSSKYQGNGGDVVLAVASNPDLLTHTDKSTIDTTEMWQDPRAMEMVAHLFENMDLVSRSKFFSDEERHNMNEYLMILVRGKIGENAARLLKTEIDNKDNRIKPSEILTLKSRELDKHVVEKFCKLKSLSQLFISNSVVTYLENNIAEISKKKTAQSPEAKAQYMNFTEQLKAFTNLLDPATQITFVKKIIKAPNNLFGKVATCFSKDVLMTIEEARSALKDLNN